MSRQDLLEQLVEVNKDLLDELDFELDIYPCLDVYCEGEWVNGPVSDAVLDKFEKIKEILEQLEEEDE